MAPPGGAKRVKGVSVFRPFMYGTSAKPFDPVKNPKPAGVPDNHTHSWTVFVKAVDNSDITYWLKKVQFKLHDTIPNHIRTIEANPGEAFQVTETGWGEFEIGIKLHYPPLSGEKTNMIYHHLLLHPYGSEEQKEQMIRDGEIRAWCYDEQVFNEPLEPFYETLTPPLDDGKNGRNGGAGGGKRRVLVGGVVSLERRSAEIPPKVAPGAPFARETEELELKELRAAQLKVEQMKSKLLAEVAEKEKSLSRLRAS